MTKFFKKQSLSDVLVSDSHVVSERIPFLCSFVFDWLESLTSCPWFKEDQYIIPS